MAEDLFLRVRVPEEKLQEFINWQTHFHETTVKFPGLINLEILKDKESFWTIVQHFATKEELDAWQHSQEYQGLQKELQTFETSLEKSQRGITEIFITEVYPGMEETYRQWITRIHQAEAAFPGFKGVYVQTTGRLWVTLLQFDTPEHLEGWLSSPERAKILEEAKDVISSFENQRVYSPFPGWFEGKMTPAWKQTMVVLLVIFPIVMLEVKFLSPYLENLHLPVATFITNAISVSLLSWPMMPIALRGLNWWITSNNKSTDLIGTFFIILLYLLEIIFFINIFK